LSAEILLKSRIRMGKITPLDWRTIMLPTNRKSKAGDQRKLKTYSVMDMGMKRYTIII
jgi:hypothetical protein